MDIGLFSVSSFVPYFFFLGPRAASISLFANPQESDLSPDRRDSSHERLLFSPIHFFFLFFIIFLKCFLYSVFFNSSSFFIIIFFFYSSLYFYHRDFARCILQQTRYSLSLTSPLTNKSPCILSPLLRCMAQAYLKHCLTMWNIHIYTVS